MTPFASKRPLIGEGFLSDTLQSLRNGEATFKTAKSTGNKFSWKPDFSFAAFGDYPSSKSKMTEGVPKLSDQNLLDVAASSDEKKSVPHVPLFPGPENNYNLVNESTELSRETLNPPGKFDSVYGVSTGSSYTPACVKSPLQTICLDDPFYPT